MKKHIFFISVIVVLILIYIFLNYENKVTVYNKNYFYMDTYINVKIYTKDKKAEKILEEVDNIYKEYHYLTDRFNAYDNIENIYYINNNDSKDEFLTIDNKLYELLEYSLVWKEKSKGVFNIEIGNVIDIWKNHIEKQDGIPFEKELKEAMNTTKQVVLLENNKILNNKPNIDLGAIAKAYATDVVGQHLKDNGFNKFLINAGGHVLVGDKYRKDLYKIGIRHPKNPHENLVVVKGENISIATSGSYERFYEYENKRYNHIINPQTLFPGDYMQSVTVISNDSKLNDVLTTLLFLMPIEDGVEFVSSIDNVEAIWYSNNDKIIKSKGFEKYEQK